MGCVSADSCVAGSVEGSVGIVVFSVEGSVVGSSTGVVVLSSVEGSVVGSSTGFVVVGLGFVVEGLVGFFVEGSSVVVSPVVVSVGRVADGSVI